MSSQFTVQQAFSAPELYNGRVVRYATYEASGIPLTAQAYFVALDEDEEGEIIACEVTTDHAFIVPELKIYESGVNANPLIINNISYVEMLRRGRGMTPGDAGAGPTGQSKDPSGTPARYFFYLTRFKDETLIDYLGLEEKYFAARYEPPSHMRYRAISLILKNTSITDAANIRSITIFRRVYFSPGDPNLGSQASAALTETSDEYEAQGMPDSESIPSEDDDDDDDTGGEQSDERRSTFNYDYDPANASTEADEEDEDDQVIDEAFIVNDSDDPT